MTHPGAGRHDDLPDWSPDGSKIVFERIFQPESNSPTTPDEITEMIRPHFWAIIPGKARSARRTRPTNMLSKETRHCALDTP